MYPKRWVTQDMSAWVTGWGSVVCTPGGTLLETGVDIHDALSDTSQSPMGDVTSLEGELILKHFSHQHMCHWNVIKKKIPVLLLIFLTILWVWESCFFVPSIFHCLNVWGVSINKKGGRGGGGGWLVLKVRGLLGGGWRGWILKWCLKVYSRKAIRLFPVGSRSCKWTYVYLQLNKKGRKSRV